MSYLTLALINVGLEGETKYQLSEYMNYNFSFRTRKPSSDDMSYYKLYLVGLESLRTVSVVHSSVFHSGRIQIKFMEMAKELLEIEFIRTNSSIFTERMYIILQWLHDRMHILGGHAYFVPVEEEYSTLIINTCYIHYNWERMFNSEKTTIQEFWINDKNSIPVPMMNITDVFRYYDDARTLTEIVFLPFEGQDIYAVIVLPNRLITVEYLLSYIDSISIHRWLRYSTVKEVNVMIPKFKIFNMIDLKQPLNHFNVTRLFSQKYADMSKMMIDPGYLNSYFQFASIDIQESGAHVMGEPRVDSNEFQDTEEQIIDNDSSEAHVPIINFHVNRPFIFYVFERSNELILFFTVVTTPEIAEK
ncbi:Serpin I2 [Thelohanellus kitauei]|uniref:Serpin I2 n=1 Tax=Thelohanellus kitauei TaxID=669202 RepID=A0A0C2IVG6_THEKT|nr:Serpin I2 [Thelohanellus kitauei]